MSRLCILGIGALPARVRATAPTLLGRARTSELVGQIIRTHDGHFGGEQKAMYAAPISSVSQGFREPPPVVHWTHLRSQRSPLPSPYKACLHTRSSPVQNFLRRCSPTR